MVTEFVFVFATTALQGDIDKYAIYELFEMALPVTVIDISPIVSSATNRAITAKRMCDPRVDIFICYQKEELEKIIKEKLDTAIFLPMFDCYYAVRFFYSVMSKYKKRYGYINNASGDVAPINDDTNEKPLSLISKIRLQGDFITYVKAALYNRLLRNFIRNKAQFTVLAGTAREEQFISQGECDTNTKVIHTHSFDFERFKNTAPYKNGESNYCVFLDIFLPFHPDAAQIGYTVNPEDYYSELDNILDDIGRKFNLKILIAAHPRSDYSGSREKYYKKYKVEYGLTAALIKSAKLIVSHYSTSTAFAVMANKPVIIVDMELFQKYPLWNKMNKTYADLLQAVVIHRKEEIENLIFPIINNYAYNKFNEKYIGTCNDQQKNIWENIIDEINF